jgi:hypothetical protein
MLVVTDRRCGRRRNLPQRRIERVVADRDALGGTGSYSSLAYDPAGDQLVVAYERGTADKPRKIDECGPGSITTYISFASVALPGG